MSASRRWLSIVLSLVFLIAVVFAQEDGDGYDEDPYLSYKPPFARSLPVQILVTGVVFTLVSVLFIHLLFTGQYHWPLAPVNYTLQLAGVTTLLISLIATINVVLHQSIAESDEWPYMVSYMAVPVPPTDDLENPGEWSSAEKATWAIMTATISVLVQITHIQFLGLLYPSTLEKRLIFSLLGPLAVFSAAMQLVPISASPRVIDIASAIRNVCNATLSLLFTAALFIWGLLVNRVQAWRTDGGTAVFGAGALGLAIASTALNFLYVPREEEYVWLPGLMWAVVLWQSFLGWWWWVGAGSGATTEEVVEEVLRRGQQISGKRKERRRMRRRIAAGETDGARSETTGSSRRWRVFGRGEAPDDGNEADDHELEGTERGGQERGSNGPRRRRRGAVEGEPDAVSDSDRIYTQDRSTASNSRPRRNTSPSSTASTTTASTGTLPGFLPRVVHEWYASLRHAHVAAARVQAEERRERIMELERAERERTRAAIERLERAADTDGNRRNKNIKTPTTGGPSWFRMGVPGTGWGLGHFGWRGGNVNSSGAIAATYEMDTYGSGGQRETRPRRGNSPSSASEDYTDEDDDRENSGQRRRTARAPDATETSGPFIHYPTTNNHPPLPPEPEPRRSLWWWGPLRKWRLQDSTSY
ncbi:hypothetical protein AAF712_007493 [Marasmius tenuissimus]|uniref:Uncharacterized protein n=1 Tax=Marasmius tenuissimus TaxID=585030 RepID=A0ABR2ZWI5_9AGAR